MTTATRPTYRVRASWRDRKADAGHRSTVEGPLGTTSAYLELLGEHGLTLGLRVAAGDALAALGAGVTGRAFAAAGAIVRVDRVDQRGA